MERIDEQQERIIEKLQAYVLSLDPGDPAFDKANTQLDAMLKNRESHFKNESDAVEKDVRLEYDKEKLEKEMELGKKKNRIDLFGHVVKFCSTLVVAGVSAVQVFGISKLEYDQHNPISVPSSWKNFMMKLKP